MKQFNSSQRPCVAVSLSEAPLHARHTRSRSVDLRRGRDETEDVSVRDLELNLDQTPCQFVVKRPVDEMGDFALRMFACLL